MQKQLLINISPEELQDLIQASILKVIKPLLANGIPDDKEIMDLKEVAAYLKLSESTIYRRTHERTIPHYKKGGKLYFKRSEIEKYRDSGKQMTHDEFNQTAKRKI